jgi:Kef-type K+ transport system membrane component KefB/predicted amino acid-binding ACT domain protein
MSHDVIAVLLDILLVLVAAKLAAELAERVKIPAVVGEIVAGIVIGPSVLGLVGNGDVLRTLGELGVVLLLLEVGMEMDLGELGQVGRTSVTVAAIGVIAPLVLGLGAMLAIGDDFNTALFVAAALTATSVGITARVFGDLRALATSEARVVLGAAVADDVMGLIVLTVVVRVVTEGSVSIVSVLLVLLGALAFLVVGGAAALWMAPHIFSWLERRSRSAGTLVAMALAFTLAMSELADVAKLAVVVGAFLAGLALGRTRQRERIQRELAPVGHLFIPVFFLAIGIDVDVSSFGQVKVLRDAAILLVVAVIGKLVSVFGLFGTRNDRLLVGLGMLPRGEVGLIFATIGLNSGVLGEDLYAALLLVVLATTLITPMLLRARYARLARAAEVVPVEAETEEPVDGWFVEHDNRLSFRSVPPSGLTLHLALVVARMITRVSPSPDLLDWFAEHRQTRLEWTERETRGFLALLDESDARSWRFLESIDVLARALPELADALHDRRRDPYVLDPSGLHHWDLLEQMAELAATPAGAWEMQKLRYPDSLRLAAFLIDVLGDRPDRVDASHAFVDRLGLSAGAAHEIAALVEDPSLFVNVARQRRAFDEPAVLQIASHYGNAETARAAFVLALARAGDPLDREALRELHGFVDTVLRAATWDPESQGIVDSNRREAAQASDGSDAVLERIATAPRAYVLLERPRRVAGHAEMLGRWRPRGRPRVLVEVRPPTRHDPRCAVDVVAADRPGLLARVASVLADTGLDVNHAIVATWPDGAALESFLVDATAVPSAADLSEAIARAAAAPLTTDALSGAVVDFDDVTSPWYTRVRVDTDDRPRRLIAIAGALAAAGIDVHSADIRGEGGIASDVFEVTGSEGGKLRAGERVAVVDLLRSGAVLSPPRSRLHRAWDRLRATWVSGDGQEEEIRAPSL